MIVHGDYTHGNADDMDKAVQGLNQFMKNWCMNCKETKEQDTLVFRCDECEFRAELGLCRIKEFVVNKTGDIPSGFGSMSR